MVANPAYYPHDFADEVLPNDLKSSDLAGWGAWLGAGGDKVRKGEEECAWTVDVPADGAEFKATETTWLDDVEVERDADGEVTFNPPLPAEFDFLAIRFGPGMGWSPEDILSTTDPDKVAAVLIEEHELNEGDDCLLAVGKSQEVMLTYRSNPPRLEITGLIQ